MRSHQFIIIGYIAKASSSSIQEPQTIRGISSQSVQSKATKAEAADAENSDYIVITNRFGRVHRLRSSEKEMRALREFKDQYDLTEFEEFTVSRAFLAGKPFKEACKYHGQY